MSAPPNYRANWTSGTLALEAATPRTIDVPIDGATSWTIVVKNTGSNAVTAITLARIPLAMPGAAVSVTDGIPLAAGDTLPPIVGENAPLKALRLVLTSTSGTTVEIEAGGA